MELIRHVPSFVEIERNTKNIKFNTLDEFLNIELIKNISKVKSFYRFSIEDDDILMAEYKKGEIFHVIGFIKGQNTLDLPKWENFKN